MFKSKRKRIAIILVLVLAVAGFLIYDRLKQPSVGTIEASGNLGSLKTTFDFTPVKVSDNYISFSYPKSLKKQPNNPQYAPQVDQFNYSYTDNQNWDLAISTDKTSVPLTENSGYMLRKNNPALYTESQQTIAGNIAYMFQDKVDAGFSKAAFLSNGSYQASVSLTGDDFGVETNLEKTFDEVINSWQWKAE